MHGTGQMTYIDGRIYKGEYYEDKKHGQGLYMWPNGKMYEGDWYQGKQHGKGTFTNTKGISQTGTWSNGKIVNWDSNNSLSSKSNGLNSLVGSGQMSCLKSNGTQKT